MYEEKKKFVTVRTRERVEYMMDRRKIYIVVVHLIIREKKITVSFSLSLSFSSKERERDSNDDMKDRYLCSSSISFPC